MQMIKGGKIRTPKPKKTRSYSKKKKAPAKNVAKVNNSKPEQTKQKLEFPEEFPFWAKMVIGGNHHALIVDECKAKDENKKLVDGFKYREATTKYKDEFLEIRPNPEKGNKEPMYLRRIRKKPKRIFVPPTKTLGMPQVLIEMYGKDTKK